LGAVVEVPLLVPLEVVAGDVAGVGWAVVDEVEVIEVVVPLSVLVVVVVV
jgi:hypothetical protein